MNAERTAIEEHTIKGAKTAGWERALGVVEPVRATKGDDADPPGLSPVQTALALEGIAAYLSREVNQDSEEDDVVQACHEPNLAEAQARGAETGRADAQEFIRSLREKYSGRPQTTIADDINRYFEEEEPAPARKLTDLGDQLCDYLGLGDGGGR